jgi:serine/threonine protein phosphatase 1
LNFMVDDPLKATTPFHCLWLNSGYAQTDKLGGRTLLTGHTVTTMDQIRASLRSPKVCLDNGAFTNRPPDYGNLVALNLDRQELICQQWIDY